jgi:hypothetical protein
LRSKPSREKFKLALGDAITARGAASGESGGTLTNFSAWLNGLPDKELDKVVSEVDDDCRHAQIELDWLLDGRAKGEMRTALQDTVLLSAMTVWRGRTVEPFVRLEDYLAKPNARHNRKFGQDVFARLVNAGRIVIPAELLVGAENERHKFAFESISNLAQQDQDAVIAVVRETLGDTTTASTQTTAPPPAETKTIPSAT